MDHVLEYMARPVAPLATHVRNAMEVYPFDDRREMKLPCMKHGKTRFMNQKPKRWI